MRFYNCKRAKYEEPSPDEYLQIFAENGILEKIFKKVECRRQLSLVSKLCYQTVCKLDNSEDIYRARFDQDNITWEGNRLKDNVFASTIRSSREVTEIYLNQMYFVDIVDEDYEENYQKSLYYFTRVLMKLAANVKKLTLYSCLMTESHLMFILDALSKSKLEELYILESAIIYETTKKYKKPVLVFPLLEKIEISKTNYGNPNSAVPNASTNCAMYDFLRSVCENSKQLKSLSLPESLAKWISFDKFQLTHLCIQKACPSDFRLASIVCGQIYLTAVDFLDCFIMEDVINEVLKLPHLKGLRVNLAAISIKGFTNICNKKSLKELGFKCCKSSWIINAMIMTNLNFLKKLYLDVRNLHLNQNSLGIMLNRRIPELHVVASQYFVLESIFSSTYVENLKICTVEIYIEKLHYKKLLTRYHDRPCHLRQFTLINRNQTVIDYNFNLNYILEQCVFLEKIRIEGFNVTKHLFEASIKNHEHLQELYLLNPKHQPNDFVFDKSYGDLIQLYGRNLKTLEISCSKSKLKRSNQFPFVIRRHGVKIYRRR